MEFTIYLNVDDLAGMDDAVKHIAELGKRCPNYRFDVRITVEPERKSEDAADEA